MARFFTIRHHHKQGQKVARSFPEFQMLILFHPTTHPSPTQQLFGQGVM